jgi:hypothetical protein
MLLEYKEKGNSVHHQALEAKAGHRQNEAVSGGDTWLATWVSSLLVSIALVLMLSVWFATGRRERPQSPTAAQYPSLILIDEVDHLPSLAWKAIPLSLPHGGIVNIDVQVVRGNPIDIFLIAPDQLDNVEKVEWSSLKVSGDIGATRTKSFRRAMRLEQGGFYLVVRDMTVGTPSSPPSDVSVKVQLTP